MRRTYWIAAAAMGLGLSGCGGGTEEKASQPANAAEPAAANVSADATASTGPVAASGIQGCPFKKTTNWVGSVERGYLRVNGDVDLMMAGFKPQLTLREGSSGGATLLDLALVPEPNADISSHVKLEKAGTAPNRRAEIWCGGERIAAFDMVVV
jgi:hypothetical protein